MNLEEKETDVGGRMDKNAINVKNDNKFPGKAVES